MAIEVRTWVEDDLGFLWEVLHASLHVRAGDPPFPRSVLDEPHLAHYLSGFGRLGDDAVVAVDSDGRSLGAAWCRLLPADDPGYGFVAADVPELSMAVVAGHRGRGVGRALLAELLGRHPTMSLSVDTENTAALALYRSVGFEAVGGDATSLTLLRRPAPSGPAPIDPTPDPTDPGDRPNGSAPRSG